MPMSERGNDSGARKNGIGARLQAGRERADLSLVQAAELLHVDPNVIHALETENFSELGAPVYARGHMRHYAELVKESVPELLGLYAASVHAAAPPDLTRMPHAQQTNPWRGAVVMTGVAVVIGIGLIGSIHWLYLDLHPVSSVHKVAPVTAPAIVVPAEPISAPGPAAAANNS
jgi:cytoskeleton protein RodZ